MSDKRNIARKPSFLGGTITYNHDLWSADCVVKNISDTGAKLMGRNLPVLPERFDLLIPQRKARYRVLVRWRDKDQIGVVFEHTYPSETAVVAPKVAARIRDFAAGAGDEPPERLITDLAI
jgi:hypothetical protein